MSKNKSNEDLDGAIELLIPDITDIILGQEPFCPECD